MAHSRDASPMTLEVVVVALAPQIVLNMSSLTPMSSADLETLSRDHVFREPSGGTSHVGNRSDVNYGLETFKGFVRGGGKIVGPVIDRDSAGNTGHPEDAGVSMVSAGYIALFSTLFCVVGVVGLAGNILVIYIILNDKKMRKSVTNLLILNLAVADSLLMVFGVPEIVQFMLDKGWLLGLIACKINRSVLVCALYGSVLTLVAVCIER